MQNNLERINPDLVVDNEILGQQTLELHLQRYRFAAKHIKDGILADIACGVGYGSHLLAEECSERITQIFAVDNDPASIKFASRRYAHRKITFVEGDAAGFHAPQALDSIVSLETIEHLTNPADFIRRLSKQLVSGGRFIASVPITPSMDANPYHLHDFTEKSFKKLFADCGLKEVASMLQEQRYNLKSIMQQKEERSKDLRKNITGYYFRHPSKLLLRLRSLLADGLTNKYMVTAFEKK